MGWQIPVCSCSRNDEAAASKKLNQACIDRELDFRPGLLFAAGVVHAGDERPKRQRLLRLMMLHDAILRRKAWELLWGVHPIGDFPQGRLCPSDMALASRAQVCRKKRATRSPDAGDASGGSISMGAALPAPAELASHLFATAGTSPGSSGGVRRMVPLLQEGGRGWIIRFVLNPELGLKWRRRDRLGHLLVQLDAADAGLLQHVLE